MKSCVVSISEIMKDSNHNLSAKYWCDKKVKGEKNERENKVLQHDKTSKV